MNDIFFGRSISSNSNPKVLNAIIYAQCACLPLSDRNEQDTCTVIQDGIYRKTLGDHPGTHDLFANERLHWKYRAKRGDPWTAIFPAPETEVKAPPYINHWDTGQQVCTLWQGDGPNQRAQKANVYHRTPTTIRFCDFAASRLSGFPTGCPHARSSHPVRRTRPGDHHSLFCTTEVAAGHPLFSHPKRREGLLADLLHGTVRGTVLLEAQRFAYSDTVVTRTSHEGMMPSRGASSFSKSSIMNFELSTSVTRNSNAI